MPIYEYRCQQCGHELEKLQRMGDEPLRDCPACEQPGLKRLISASVFRLKGGGWYETDFKQGQKRNIADSGNESPASKDSTESGEGKSKKAESGKVESGKAESGKVESSKVESKSAQKDKAGTG